LSLVADALRPFWMPGLKDITGNPDSGLADWIGQGKDFQVFDPVDVKRFSVHITDPKTLRKALAHDCSRFTVAAFETSSGNVSHLGLPKGRAWLFIRNYYAAFFAAHALLRIFGISCTYLERKQANKVTEIGRIFGTPIIGSGAVGGFYCLRAEFSSMKLSSVGSGNEGSHEFMWMIFHDKLNAILTQIPTLNLPGQTKKISSERISEILMAMNLDGLSNGNWFSKIRNETNYKHAHSAWFPYNRRPEYYDDLFTAALSWRSDSELISVHNPKDKQQRLKTFVTATSLIVSILREVVLDMANRCDRGRSFHQVGGLQVLNLERPTSSGSIR
jgi:hypothetical protein